jgi:hypothetical protein
VEELDESEKEGLDAIRRGDERGLEVLHEFELPWQE